MLTDQAIPDDYVQDVCKAGQGPDTCAYLSMTGAGYHCAKNIPPVLAAIQARLAEGTMKAQGDNCPGYDGAT